MVMILSSAMAAAISETTFEWWAVIVEEKFCGLQFSMPAWCAICAWESQRWFWLKLRSEYELLYKLMSDEGYPRRVPWLRSSFLECEYPGSIFDERSISVPRISSWDGLWFVRSCGEKLWWWWEVEMMCEKLDVEIELLVMTGEKELRSWRQGTDLRETPTPLQYNDDCWWWNKRQILCCV